MNPVSRLTIVATIVALSASVLAESPQSSARQSNTAPPLPAAALARLDMKALEAHVRFLSDDLLEGRAPSTRGGELAARYIAAMFQAAGLEPGAADGTYFQQVPIVESRVEGTVTLGAAGTASRETLASPADLVAFSGSNEPRVQVEGPLVFVGYGIVAPEYKWNDYAGVDVKGKVVLMMVNDPPAPPDEPALFGGRALTYYGRWTYKYEEAARQGAAGAILIHTTESASYPFSVVQSSWGGTQYAIEPPAGAHNLGLKAWVTEDAARRLAAAGGKDLDALRKAAGARGARPVDLGVTVSASLAQQVARKQSPNVIGKRPGRTPEAGSIVLTSHYDHLGRRDEAAGDRIYNGARDNASGIAGLIELAELFVAAPPPARDVYFVATTAEESGLLGSEYLAVHPPMAIDRVAANLNMDSLNIYGPASEVVMLGSERSTLGDLLARFAKAEGRTVGLDPHPERGYFFRSDHFPLAKAGVPALSISLADPSKFTGPRAEKARAMLEAYNAKHYHQPSDEWSPEWDFTGALQDLGLLARLGWELANMPEMPAYHQTEAFARPRRK